MTFFSADRTSFATTDSRPPRQVERFRASCLFLVLSCCVSGCGDANTTKEPSTPLARRAGATFETPLSEEEITTFLAIVGEFSAGQLPSFEPLPSPAIDDRLPAQTLVNAYRREYRRTFDPVDQAERWRRNPKLMSVLTARGIEPETFADLLTRLGCALAAGTVNSRLNLSVATEKTDQQLSDLIARIDQWDQRAAQGTVHHSAIAQRRQPLVDQLKDLVALSEFSRLLLGVPEESLRAVDRHKQALSVYLPQSQDVHRFERTLDADAVVVPVSYERPVPNSSSR
ncbi:MAG: hypothetical protein KF861_16045 [Planctomycetaceae bacterium]|nr:hypothetical protein [Planctomycetaceae bacterium]